MAGNPEVEAVDDSVAEPEGAQGERLSQSTLYTILADPRRRNLIHSLKQSDGPRRVGELAEQLAAWENGKDPSALTSQERKRVYISLYQSHLPTLDKAGVVEYDRERGVVTLSEDMSRHRIYLEIVPRNDIPWSFYYVGLTLLGMALLALAWQEVYPFGMVPDLVWAAVLLVLFGGSALVQTVLIRRRVLGDSGPPPDVEV